MLYGSLDVDEWISDISLRPVGYVASVDTGDEVREMAGGVWNIVTKALECGEFGGDQRRLDTVAQAKHKSVRGEESHHSLTGEEQGYQGVNITITANQLYHNYIIPLYLSFLFLTLSLPVLEGYLSLHVLSTIFLPYPSPLLPFYLLVVSWRTKEREKKEEKGSKEEGKGEMETIVNILCLPLYCWYWMVSKEFGKVNKFLYTHCRNEASMFKAVQLHWVITKIGADSYCRGSAGVYGGQAIELYKNMKRIGAVEICDYQWMMGSFKPFQTR